MCHPIIVGAAIGAATSAITVGDPLMGAVLGGVTGGMSMGAEGVASSGFLSDIGSMGGVFSTATTGSAALFPGVSMAAAVGMGVTGLAGGMALNMRTPQQQSYNQSVTGLPYAPQAYSSQHATVTGSGGRQAAAVLASEIKQAKKLRQRQAEVAVFGLGMATTGTGLQIA